MRHAASLAVMMSLALLSACSTGAPTGGEPVTLALVNAKIWTGDAARPWAEALAVAGERIVAVGTTDEIRAMAGDAPAIDGHGRLVTPGFNDAHVHFLQGGFDLASVQLRDAATPEEFAGRLADFAASVPEGRWITGGNWDHELWGGELPRADWIDAGTTGRPVMVSRLDGHMVLANTAAMQAAAVTRATRDVEGGTIVRDANGEPTGVFKDNAMSLFDGAVPAPSSDELDTALRAAMAYAAAQGVTSVQHVGTWTDLETFRRARDANELTTRVYAAVPLASWERLRDTITAKTLGADGRGDAWLHIGALKGFVDGSLGSHTAAFEEPFTDAPRDRGLFVNTPEELYAWISGADKAGLHVVVHAIGDRANQTLLDIYARVEEEDGPRDRRFRIEHAQHLAASDIQRFAALGVIPSMQPYHAIDDGRWAEKVIGPERIKTTYAFRSLLDAGARLAFGSDWPVAPATPLEGIYAAVTRRTLDDEHPGGWVPEQKIGVEDALRAYTTGAAFAEFTETDKGQLAPGQLADFVVIDRDLFSIPPEEIQGARVTMTVVGGKIAHAVLGEHPATGAR